MSLYLKTRFYRESFQLEAELRLEHPVTGFFGPSGSGKTTLLSLIAGLVHPQEGRVELDGELLFDAHMRVHLPPHRRGIGYLFQDSQLFPHLTIRGNLLYGYHRVPPEKRRLAPEQVIELLEIGSLLSRRPRNLSGGEKQRVAMGRALLTSPRLLLLDEPLASLDEGLKRQILPFLKRVKDEINIPMIYVSHAIGEILQLADMLVVMDRGKVLGYGHFLEVMKDERILDLAESLGLENVIPVEVVKQEKESGITVARVHGHELKLPLISVPSGRRIYVAVRPEDIVLAIRPVEGTSIQNQLKGTIRGLSEVGSRALIHVDLGVPLLAEISLKAVRDLGLKEGHQVFCLIKSRSFTFLGGNGN